MTTPTPPSPTATKLADQFLKIHAPFLHSTALVESLGTLLESYRALPPTDVAPPEPVLCSCTAYNLDPASLTEACTCAHYPVDHADETGACRAVVSSGALGARSSAPSAPPAAPASPTSPIGAPRRR